MIADFLTAAFPWIVIGLGVAIAMVYISCKGGKNGK